jgi:hypothetical protein
MTERPWSVAWLALCAAFAGCSTTVNVVPEPLACPVPPEVLAQRCAEPVSLADGATYGDLVRAGVEDRNALRVCARHDRLLADTLRECNASLERYKVQIREINDKLGKKP